MSANRSASDQLNALASLQTLSLKLGAALTLDETLAAIVDSAVVICRADHAAISYISESGELLLLKHRGLSQEYIKERNLNRLDPVLAGIMTTRLPLIIEDIDELADVTPNYPAWKKEGIASLVSLPLMYEGKVFGVIGAGSLSVSRYSKTEIDAMSILATQAGAAIVNARLLDQLREANRAKDEFFSTLSHELRTPLTPILGWTHLLKPFAGLDPLLAQGIDIIERNAKQLSELIRDLLDLTRIISNKVELERTPTDLTPLVHTVVAQMLPPAEARGIMVELSVPDEPIVSDLDPIRIQQVISNLLGNAVKFTPEGGRASVVLKRDAGGPSGSPPGAVIEFTDTGIGIAPDFLPFVFERFSQAHEGIDRRFDGLGLGLAITRALVELHGGKVTAKSDGPGTGSTFTVTLPIAVGRPADGEDKTLESVADDREIRDLCLRVLLIDDSPDTLNMLSLWLSTFGCEVLIATEATEGVRVAKEKHPNLIISDIGMPDVDGYELMRRLRRTPGLEQMPAIALTGYAREEDRELALAAGYDAHIPKPANLERLLYLIRKLTRGKKT